MKLKLTGLESFTYPKIPQEVVRRDDEVEVDEEVGEALLEMHVTSLNDGIKIPYFTRVGDGEASKSSTPTPDKSGDADEPDAGKKATTAAPAKKTVTRTQRGA